MNRRWANTQSGMGSHHPSHHPDRPIMPLSGGIPSAAMPAPHRRSPAAAQRVPATQCRPPSPPVASAGKNGDSFQRDDRARSRVGRTFGNCPHFSVTATTHSSAPRALTSISQAVCHFRFASHCEQSKKVSAHPKHQQFPSGSKSSRRCLPRLFHPTIGDTKREDFQRVQDTVCLCVTTAGTSQQ